MLKITKGKQTKPQKVVIYGPEGIGKTTFASKFPNPLIIDTEGGSCHLDVSRTDCPKSWDEFINAVHDCADTEFATIVIDTADWAEQVCIESICQKNNVKSIESFGYGKGYTYIGEEFARLLKACDELIAKGKHVVITAHAKMRKFEQPDEMGAYDRWEMKLTRQVAPLVKEWADMVLFCNYQTIVITDSNNSKKAQGGKRVVYASHHPCWDAKNRHGLPDKFDMDFSKIAHCFETEKTEKAEIEKASEADMSPYGQIVAKLKESGISSQQFLKVMADRGKGNYETLREVPEQIITDWGIKYFDKIQSIVKGESK